MEQIPWKQNNSSITIAWTIVSLVTINKWTAIKSQPPIAKKQIDLVIHSAAHFNFMKGSFICQLGGVWQDYMTMLEVIADKVCSPGKFSFKKYLQVANFSSFHGQTQENMNSICICSCRDTKGLLSMKIYVYESEACFCLWKTLYLSTSQFL